jgi:hypothetical protein
LHYKKIAEKWKYNVTILFETAPMTAKVAPGDLKEEMVEMQVC